MADEQPKRWWERYERLITWVVVAVVSGLLGGVFGVQVAPVPPPVVVEREVAVPVMDEFAEPRAQGWQYDPAEAEAVRAGRPAFADTPAGRAALAADGDVYLWDAPKKALGAVLPARDQGDIGSCVSFATASAVEHLLCVQIARGDLMKYRDVVQEAIYGGSRVEVGGGKIRGDGSIGAWAVEWVSKWGLIPRGVHGDYDLSKYSTARCREWGNRGVPDVLEPVARESPVKGYALVTTFAEADKAVRQGYPLLVCSGQGFRMRRDADGFCAPSGTWYHAMAVVGTRGGKRPGLFFLNSWGPNAHTGPRFPADAPEAGFWVDAEVAEKMLRGWKDSYALSDAVGFPARKLDWFILAPRRPAPVAPFHRLQLRPEEVSIR